MNWNGRLARALLDAFERSARLRVLTVLRGMDQRRLIDMGYSLELLRKGVDGWPWRVEEVGETLKAPSSEEIRTAEAMLSEHSEVETPTLASNQGQIPDVNQKGRPGIEDIAA